MENSCRHTFADTVLMKEWQKKVDPVGGLSTLGQVLSLSGNEVRLKILYLLSQEDNPCVCDLSDILQMTIPAVSQHPRMPKDGNLIQSRKPGQTIYYSLRAEQMDLLNLLFEDITDTKSLKHKV